MTCNERISSHISVIEWESNNEIWFKWGQNEKEKNLGHLPCFKNFLIPLSFKSLTIIPRWENYHSGIISFILRSFSIWMTIEWQNRHFTMTQNDRDEQRMRVIKSSPSKISLIPISFRSFYHHSPITSLGHSSPLGGASCINLHIHKIVSVFLSFLHHSFLILLP